MAGLLAWAADVVGGGTNGQNNDDDNEDNIPIIFSPDQQNYAIELDRKSTNLNRSIQDLRLRIPPPDISQRLPHLHAHSLASNAALALQLNAHSSTREQAELREITLQEENVAYKKAVSNCEHKIQEKMQEADHIKRKLEEVNLTEQTLIAELENAQSAMQTRQSGKSFVKSKSKVEAQADRDAEESDLFHKLESKKKELQSMEKRVQNLEKRWKQVQDNALKLPSPAQREKVLDKQLHSLLEQLAGKQAQAESLVSDIRFKEAELERLNTVATNLNTSNLDANATARNRNGRSNFEIGSSASSSGYMVDAHHKHSFNFGGRTQNQQRLMLLRSASVLYILALHVLVFIKISF